MDLPQPLERGTLLRRYKRFLADVALDGGGTEVVHVPNPGAMMGLADPGLTVWCSRSASPTRKLPLTLEMVEADGDLVGVNTHRPNGLVAEALANAAIPALAPWPGVRREVVVGESRFDFRLEGSDGRVLMLEVKNCHLRRQGRLAEFPDCRAARSARHARHLARLAREGLPAAVAFVVQRMDCDAFAPADDIDPDFGRALREARDAGVAVMALACRLSRAAIRIEGSLPVRL